MSIQNLKSITDVGCITEFVKTIPEFLSSQIALLHTVYVGDGFERGFSDDKIAHLESLNTLLRERVQDIN